MMGRSPMVALVVASFVAVTYAPQKAHAQNAGAVLGGVLGGVIAGAIIANARPRPVIYGRRHAVRAVPRTRVARVRAPARQPAAPQGAAIISASADPFSKTQRPPVTTPVSAQP